MRQEYALGQFLKDRYVNKLLNSSYLFNEVDKPNDIAFYKQKDFEVLMRKYIKNVKNLATLHYCLCQMLFGFFYIINLV